MKTPQEIKDIYKEIGCITRQLKRSKSIALNKKLTIKRREEIARELRLLCTDLSLLVSDVFDEED